MSGRDTLERGNRGRLRRGVDEIGSVSAKELKSPRRGRYHLSENIFFSGVWSGRLIKKVSAQGIEP